MGLTVFVGNCFYICNYKRLTVCIKNILHVIKPLTLEDI